VRLSRGGGGLNGRIGESVNGRINGVSCRLDWSFLDFDLSSLEKMI